MRNTHHSHTANCAYVQATLHSSDTLFWSIHTIASKSWKNFTSKSLSLYLCIPLSRRETHKHKNALTHCKMKMINDMVHVKMKSFFLKRNNKSYPGNEQTQPEKKVTWITVHEFAKNTFKMHLSKTIARERSKWVFYGLCNKKNMFFGPFRAIYG